MRPTPLQWLLLPGVALAAPATSSPGAAGEAPGAGAPAGSARDLDLLPGGRGP